VAEELRDLGLLKDETGDITYSGSKDIQMYELKTHTKLVVSQSLYNLRHKEECKTNRMLLQYTMGILK
jgi:hypothetical protein